MSTETKEFLLFRRCKRRWRKDGERRPTDFPLRDWIDPSVNQLNTYWKVKHTRCNLRDIKESIQSDTRKLGRRLA